MSASLRENHEPNVTKSNRKKKKPIKRKAPDTGSQKNKRPKRGRKQQKKQPDEIDPELLSLNVIRTDNQPSNPDLMLDSDAMNFLCPSAEPIEPDAAEPPQPAAVASIHLSEAAEKKQALSDLSIKTQTTGISLLSSKAPAVSIAAAQPSPVPRASWKPPMPPHNLRKPPRIPTRNTHPMPRPLTAA